MLLGSIQGVDLDALVFVARRQGAQELDHSATERHFMSEPILRFLPRDRPNDRVELGRKCESVSSALEQRGLKLCPSHPRDLARALSSQQLCPKHRCDSMVFGIQLAPERPNFVGREDTVTTGLR
jgi:hypothetical protein